VDPTLDASSSTAWYLAASPADIDTIEVTYLNGQQAPVLYSNTDYFQYLGIQFQIMHDVGVTPLDYRGLYKNGGA
jgi:hypothetical protein